MKIYLLTQNDNTGYDTYDSCIVCAENEEDAKTISPDGDVYFAITKMYPDWALSKETILCKEIGEANKSQIRGVILASFNAG